MIKSLYESTYLQGGSCRLRHMLVLLSLCLKKKLHMPRIMQLCCLRYMPLIAELSLVWLWVQQALSCTEWYLHTWVLIGRDVQGFQCSFLCVVTLSCITVSGLCRGTYVLQTSKLCGHLLVVHKVVCPVAHWNIYLNDEPLTLGLTSLS
jgi:hypothetical protein